MNSKYFIGADISKSKIDFAVITSDSEVLLEQIVPNTEAKLRSFFKHLLKQLETDADSLLVCCENTGIYGRHLEKMSMSMNLFLWCENAYKIKKASSDIRGKSDKKDALRIARYAYRYQDLAQGYAPKSPIIQKIENQTKIRETLIVQLSGLQNQLREAKTHDKELFKDLQKGYKPVIEKIKQQIQKVEETIRELYQQDQKLNENVKLITSIKGVGLQTALAVIINTENFNKFESAKQLACYTGVVPFPNESGTIIKRPRVSHLSNKKLKKVIHMAALSAMKCNKDLRQYYQRKVGEGKNKMSVINAIRNKLIQIIYAVIKRRKPYQEEYEPIIMMQNTCFVS